MSALVNLSSFDLNRLRVLHAVLEARSVTRAAAALHVTPAAISNALALLREEFGDRLLVRSGRSLVLTPYASALAPRLAEAMEGLSRAVKEPARFDPRLTTRSFGLACSDAEQISEVPRIAAAFEQKLPRAQLRIFSVEQLEAAGGLASGEVEAALGPAHGPVPHLHTEDLYDEEGVLLVRKGHPHVRRKLTREQFNTLRHIDILLALGGPGIGHGIVEQFLASHGLRRDIAISVPSFAAAAAIASETDWVAGVPRRLAARFVRQLPLVMVESALPAITFRIQLLWHERTAADQGSQLFRSLVTTAIRYGP
jgi:DNA-binding transcriptional LysR family regulator